MTRVGLVLGAGGIVGQAYHAGVLAALEHDLGWDARTAEVIVGSSAGAVTGTLLRLGVAPADLAAYAVEAPLSLQAAQVLGPLGGERPQFPPMVLRDWVRPWRLPSVALVSRVARRPWAVRPSVVAMTLLPTGRVELTVHADRLEALTDGTWPDGLWLCAARRDDGMRVVFGRPGSPEAPLSRAVAASCAIPGYFAPVVVEGIEYFDGGVHSPTNADVLRREGLDLVVVVSPMSAMAGFAATADAPLRYAAHRRLGREVRRLRARGTTVVRFEPGTSTLRAMGLNAMATDRSDRVVQASFIEAGRIAASPRTAERLAALATRRSRREGAVALGRSA